MDKIYDITHNHDPGKRADQCEVGLRFLINLVKNLNASSYIEIGCAKLLTFSVFEDVLQKPSLLLGVDLPRYKEWDNYKSSNEIHLFSEGSTNPSVLEAIKVSLNNRQVDVLFIDGNHDEEYVQADWDNFSPFVRSGGLIIFHDWDPPAVQKGVRARQGAAIVCNNLAKKDYTILNVPTTFIGTAYLYKP